MTTDAIMFLLFLGLLLLYTTWRYTTRLPGQMRPCVFHRWHTIKDTIVHRYQVCPTCGARRITRCATGGQPIDRQWLQTGVWHVMRPPPPPPRATLTQAVEWMIFTDTDGYADLSPEAKRLLEHPE